MARTVMPELSARGKEAPGLPKCQFLGFQLRVLWGDRAFLESTEAPPPPPPSLQKAGCQCTTRTESCSCSPQSLGSSLEVFSLKPSRRICNFWTLALHSFLTQQGRDPHDSHVPLERGLVVFLYCPSLWLTGVVRVVPSPVMASRFEISSPLGYAFAILLLFLNPKPTWMPCRRFAIF